MTAAPPRPRAGQEGLAANLWRIGRWTARLGGVNTLGAVLALVGFVAVSLGLVSGLVASTFYGHRAAISRARQPVFATSEADAAVFTAYVDAHVDDLTVEVLALEPGRDGAPLPPGVERWPQPGEAVLSPALAGLLEQRGVPDRFGQVIGLISRDGLAAQTERLAYVRLPATHDLEMYGWQPASGFGVGSGDGFIAIGEVRYDRAVGELWALVVAVLILPGLLAVAAATRVADDKTRLRQVLLTRIGAGVGARAMIALPRLLAPALLSLGAVVGLLLVAAASDLTVPVKGTVLDAFVIRDALPWLLATVVVTHGLVLVGALGLVAGRHRQLFASRLVAPADRPARLRTAALLAVLAIQPWLVTGTDSATLRALSSLAAALVAVICLPAALATGLRAISAARSRRALALGQVGRFLGWRTTGYRSRSLSRVTATVCALIMVVGHAVPVFTLFAQPVVEARHVAGQIGTSVLEARTRGGLEDAAAFADMVDVAAYTLLWVPAGIPVERGPSQSPIEGGVSSQDRTVLTATCPDLQALGVPCVDGPLEHPAPTTLSAVLGWFASRTAVEVTVGGIHQHTPRIIDLEEDVWAEPALFLGSRDGGDLDPLVVGRDAYLDGRVNSVSQIGGTWIVGDRDTYSKGGWLLVFGLPGVGVLLLVGTLTWAAVVIEESRSLAANPLVAERQDIFAQVAATRVAVPVILGGLSGVAVTTWLLVPHALIDSAAVPVAFLAASALATLLAASLGWQATTRLTTDLSRRRWTT